MVPIDIFPSPALVVDAGLKVIAANARAEQLAGTAEFFRQAKGRKLTLNDTEAEGRLTTVLRTVQKNAVLPAQDFVICNSRGDVNAARAASSKANRLLIVIVPFQAGVDRINFLLIFRRLNQRRALNGEAMRREFQLTRSECLALETIGSGDDMAVHAQQQGISQITARNHLRSAAGKLDMARQFEIAAFVAQTSLFAIAAVTTSPADGKAAPRKARSKPAAVKKLSGQKG